MSFDGLVMSAIKHELNNTLIGGRVEKIYQPLPAEVVLIIHRDRTKHRLLISADPRDARVHLTSTVRENPLTPPIFCMVLRKHLEGGKIAGIEQPGLERVLYIKFEAVDELGMLSGKNLICEVMGKHSNIVLTETSSNVILDGINRFSYATSRHREILPGRQYVCPPESGKMNPLEVTEDQFRNAIWDPDSEQPLQKIILSKFEGLSPQTCREIVIRAGLEPTATVEFIGELDLCILWAVFDEIRSSALTGTFHPSICYEGKRPAAYSALGLTQFPNAVYRNGTMSDVLEEYYSTREYQEKFARAAGALLKTVADEIKKCKKKISIHEDTLKKAEDADTLKILGELVTANIFQLEKGAKAIEVVNYYDPGQKTVTIPLDTRLTPAENAQQYFKKYTKSRHSKEVSQNYLQDLNKELQYLESVLTALEQAEQFSELDEIKAELVKESYLKPEQAAKGTKKPTPVSEPVPLKFVSAEGFTILVGRNNRQNDYLTMKLADQEDLWFHVKDIPGSHVVVKNPGGRPIPDKTIETAAQIAAFFSKARNSSKVPVDYALRKHVRKPRGAKPGMVIYDNQNTIMVEPKTPD